MARVDYEKMSKSYDAARRLGAEGLESWRLAVGSVLTGFADPMVLDVGSGTDQWARLFPLWFGAQVIAVEPSEGMRRRGVEASKAEHVTHISGVSES